MIARIINKYCLLFCAWLWASASLSAQNTRIIPNNAFQRGEELTYRIHYGFIDAAVATITIENEDRIIDGRDTYHVVGIGKSKGAFSLFFKVNDRYETYIDTKSICPLMFIRRVDEGGYKIHQDMLFDQKYHVINSTGKEFYNMPPYIQDMLSSFYYARTFSFKNEYPGKLDSVTCFVDNQIWTLKIKFIRYDTLNSDIGKVRCMVFEPMVQKGRIFKKSNDLKVWITDDSNHIPLRAQASILFGSLKMDLESYSGLVSNFHILN